MEVLYTDRIAVEIYEITSKLRQNKEFITTMITVDRIKRKYSHDFCLPYTLMNDDVSV